MRITDATRADTETRKYRKIQTLLNTIERQYDFYSRRMPHRLHATHEFRYQEATSNLRAHLAGEEQNESREINSSLSSREMSKKSVKDTITEIFEGLPQPTKRQYTPYEQALIDHMNETGITQRVAQAKLLLAYEIAYRAHIGHFILFNTLTVTNENLNATFSKNSTIFKEYIRRFRRNLPPTNTEDAYFAVVEEGGQTGRLHIHVIHFIEKLPPDAHDPNEARQIPNHWEIDAFKKLWDTAWTAPKMVRYSPIDAYGRIGWRWPYDRKTNEPYQIGSPLRLATYMSKYITKSYASNKRTQYQWRIRKTHNLGLTIPGQLLSMCTLQDLLNIATNDNLTATLNQRKIPPALLRTMALREYQKRRLNLTTELHKPALSEMAKNIATRPSLLQCSRDSIQNVLTNNLQNIGLTTIIPTDSEAIYNFITGTSYNKTKSRLTAATTKLNAQYFGRTIGGYGTANTGDYIR